MPVLSPRRGNFKPLKAVSSWSLTPKEAAQQKPSGWATGQLLSLSLEDEQYWTERLNQDPERSADFPAFNYRTQLNSKLGTDYKMTLYSHSACRNTSLIKCLIE